MDVRRGPLAVLTCLAMSAACASGAAAPVSAALPASPVAPTPTATAAPVPTPTAAPTPTVPPRVALPVHFHPQRDPDWCDPADLQMWLELDGVNVGATGEVAIQQRLWNYEISHNDGFTLDQWHASPYAVAATLDHFAGRTDVGDQAFKDVRTAGVAISASVAGQHEPLIALIDNGTHYVLLSGVTLGPGGVGAPPASVTVNDPWTYGPTRVGYATMGTTSELAWPDFVKRFTPDDPRDVGIWSGRWVLMATGLPLRG
jgi:hypothetical protein